MRVFVPRLLNLRLFGNPLRMLGLESKDRPSVAASRYLRQVRAHPISLLMRRETPYSVTPAFFAKSRRGFEGESECGACDGGSSIESIRFEVPLLHGIDGGSSEG